MSYARRGLRFAFSAGALVSLLPLLSLAACATSVDDEGTDLFGPETGSDGVEAGPSSDGGGTTPLPGFDASMNAPDTTAPGFDSSAASDAPVADDTATPPPPGVDSSTGGASCGTATKYTFEWLAAVALLPEGGTLPACPCPSGQCCFSPLGSSPVCLPQ